MQSMCLEKQSDFFEICIVAYSLHISHVISGRFGNTGLYSYGLCAFFLSLSLSFVVLHGPGNPRVGPVYLRRRQLLHYVDRLIYGWEHNGTPACKECR